MQSVPSAAWTRLVDCDLEVLQTTPDGRAVTVTVDAEGSLVFGADVDVVIRRADGRSPAGWKPPAVAAKSVELVWYGNSQSVASVDEGLSVS